MIRHHVEDDDLNQAADPEVDPAEDEVVLDLVAIEVDADHDPYHQQNIRNKDILAIAKILHDRDVLVYSI